MWRRLPGTCDSRLGGGAKPELAEEVGPLEGQLPSTDRDPPGRARASTLLLVESVPAPPGLGIHSGEIGIDRCDRRRMGTEAIELGMMTVAGGAVPEDRPGEKGFTPERDEPLGVQMARVE